MKHLNKHIVFIVVAVSMAAVCVPAAFALDTPLAASGEDALYNTVAALDTAVFDSFNKCSSPEQLKIHASYFAPDVEFYHDTGGVTWTRQDMLANTAKNACGHYRRALVPGTLKVFPIKDYGAIEQGVHRFCQIKTGACEGMADFIIIWTNQGGDWKITRVLSYGHRATQEPKI
ncbi:MAG TPA: nuclear transport factor 2 family protein [Gammaproteobacteria bacterium]|nr:nuclear transport factor 2 family protein [Gammaproteobacteria bacterium]